MVKYTWNKEIFSFGTSKTYQIKIEIWNFVVFRASKFVVSKIELKGCDFIGLRKQDGDWSYHYFSVCKNIAKQQAILFYTYNQGKYFSLPRMWLLFVETNKFDKRYWTLWQTV